MANEIEKKTEQPGSKLAAAALKITNFYIGDIANINESVGVPLTDEARRCGVNAVIALCSKLGANEVNSLPRDQIMQVLQFVTINCLDVNSGQVFIDIRTDYKTGNKTVQAVPSGNAYEIMTKRFGVDVKTIHQAKIVHEGDEFTLPQYDGLKTTDIHFKPTLEGMDKKAIAIYYIIEKTDGTLDYAIATREGVAKNIVAQILQATLRESKDQRAALMKKMDGMTLDELLTDPETSVYISPAYKSPSSRETMIITKMKKNALMHYTRDLGSRAYATVAGAVEAEAQTDALDKSVVSVQVDEPSGEAVKVEDFQVEEPKAENPAKPQQKEVEAAEAEEPNEEAENPAKTPNKEENADELGQMSLFGEIDEL